jgi:osmotically-inducible protein OsmY
LATRSHAALGAAAMLAALAACNDSSVSGSGGAARLPDLPRIDAAAVDDTLLVTRIKQALMADKRIDAAAISIGAAKGQVTLNGTVPAEQINRIDATVREVAGVKIVINALRPTPPASS